MAASIHSSRPSSRARGRAPRPMTQPPSSDAAPPDSNALMRRRLEKLEAWRASCINPFGGRFPVTHWAGQLQGRFAKASEEELKSAGPMSLAGRVMAMRHHGKTCFAALRDQSGQIQLYARADVLGDQYALFTDLDVGDFVGVTGSSSVTARADSASRLNSSSS